jgi:2-polyprenyl-3-methyl-5-hydroxy-6-metoxy-1,4-benzoquinol methylase
MKFATLALFFFAWTGQPKSPATSQEEPFWQDFVAWAEALEPLPPGTHVPIRDHYVEHLMAEGLSAEKAGAIFDRVNARRRGSSVRSRVYWNAFFKVGGGPNQPLPLLEEALRNVEPGKALDAAMGRGRNSIYLASIGWDVTGYDRASGALEVAESYARQADVTIRTVHAEHDDFEFGEGQWGLIVSSYAVMSVSDPRWPTTFWKALKPGGMVIFQTSWSRTSTLAELVDEWQPFRIVRYEDLDAGAVTNEWLPSIKSPTVKLVLRKDP